ncbi:CHAP domain-containing protein [Aurantiacibacter suaedae]|uniref:CHAP domain-containing protein n=1 Tax=Aurantiacibacter suaedae TaxID=2545755 RepID=UPI0010FA1B78|nr:CHAP domain-containing protein [Aurantiacibacter suaedae]
MRKVLFASLLILAAGAGAPAAAEYAAPAPGTPGTANGDYLQCVPYARQVSGIKIYGDAHTWWGQAEGHYARGHTPRVGAVMAFVPYRNMTLGHVAAVSRIVDSRTVLLRHANWSEIGGRRGQIEDDVRAVDVSPNNDWSEVRVWYAPSDALGTTHWPVAGFIYNEKPGAQRVPFRYAFADLPASPNASASVARQEGSPPPVRQQARARVQTASSNQDDRFAAELALDRIGGDARFVRAFASLR